MNSPISWTRSVRPPYLAVVSATLFITLLGVCGFLLYQHMQARLFIVTNKTLTILTAPIPTLAPHAHKSDITGVDSILAPGHGKLVESGKYVVPFDMWVTGVSFASRNAPRAVLHHLILLKEGYPNTQCPNRDEEVYTTGVDSRASATFPAPYGIFLAKGTRLYLNAMIHNPAPPRGPGGTYTDASIGYTLSYVRADHGRYKPLLFYRLFLYEGEHCMDPLLAENGSVDVFTVPARAVDFVKKAPPETENNQARMTFTEPGTVLGVGAHLHEDDGGTRMEILKNGKLFTSLTPHSIGDNPWEWQMATTTNTFSVVPGDTISIEATYTNPYDFPLIDAMGHIGIFFSPDESAPHLR